jgi:hypothetical protein
MNPSKSVITLTFGDSAENHVGMEKIGTMVEAGEGFQVSELQILYESLKEKGLLCEMHTLNTVPDQSPAAVLVLRDGVNTLLRPFGYDKESLFKEQANLDVDKKAYMYGRVVNKHARWNLCFDEVAQEPEYEHGKGRIVSFKDIPVTSALKQAFPDMFGKKALGVKCEANYYYDIQKCGIGFHGDSERRKVIGVRLGASMDLHFQWYRQSEPIGERFKIPLNGGDIYVMSEKTVGTDWKQKKIYTLRHATGCAKFLQESV